MHYLTRTQHLSLWKIWRDAPIVRQNLILKMPSGPPNIVPLSLSLSPKSHTA
jgi:hypothetical protein